ncbi:MAG: S9 family peptidase [Xanthomonadaceae bacterium]|jgi:dipeptidyl aminopeptidase/acylaminoacyl peptidase|nr:S9 family peptidase [Xanthomonadaceae bacterium]
MNPVAWRIIGWMSAVLLMGLSAPALAKRPLTAETMWDLKRLSTPAVSPDGRYTVVAVAENDREKDRPTTRLWLFDNASGNARTLTSEGVSSTKPVWSPDGTRILFESRRGDDDASQIYMISLGGGEATRVTHVPTGAGNAKWFPDGLQIAFVSKVWTDVDGWSQQGQRMKDRDESKVSARVWDKAPIRYWSNWLDERETHLYRIAVDGGEPVALTLGSGIKLMGEGSYDIAPDGKEIALVADSDTSGVRSNPDIYLLPSSGGKAVNLTVENPAGDIAPVYSLDGRWLAYSQQEIPGFYADRQRLTLVDRGSGHRQTITDGMDRSIIAPLWSKDGRNVVVAVDDAGTLRLFRIEIPSGRATPITGASNYGSPSMSTDGRVLVALNESFVLPPTLVRIDPDDGQATKMSTFNDQALAEIDFGTYESVIYPGANGEPIQMWVNYPPGFDKRKRYPLFLLIHGGPHNGITDGFAWRWNAQVFSGWGYVTAWHNFHGSSGFGQAFTDSINPDWATLPYEDTIKATEWFRSQPWIDGDRMAAGGGSYGGYLTALILGRDHPFSTLIAHAAVYNIYTQYASDFGASKRRYGEFWDNPEQFRRISPHWQAGNFATPTLIIHGEQDYRVPVNHGIELFNTLQNRGVRSRFLYYPNENHWILKQNNSLRWYAEVQNWLADYLGGSRAVSIPGSPAASAR